MRTRSLRFEVEKINNKFAYYEKPQEVGKDIIDGVKEIQRLKQPKLKNIFKGTETDTECADWATMLVPESIRNIYQDNEYREQQEYIDYRRNCLQISEPIDVIENFESSSSDSFNEYSYMQSLKQKKYSS